LRIKNISLVHLDNCISNKLFLTVMHMIWLYWCFYSLSSFIYGRKRITTKTMSYHIPRSRPMVQANKCTIWNAEEKKKENRKTMIISQQRLFSSFYVITRKEVNSREKQEDENAKDKNTALKFENLQCCAKRKAYILSTWWSRHLGCHHWTWWRKGLHILWLFQCLQQPPLSSHNQEELSYHKLQLHMVEPPSCTAHMAKSQPFSLLTSPSSTPCLLQHTHSPSLSAVYGLSPQISLLHSPFHLR